MNKLYGVFLLLIISTLLIACSASGEESKKEINIDKKIEYNDLLIEFDKIKVYEKDGEKLVTINYDWTNLSGDDFSLQSLATMEVLQNGESLKETSDSWNPENSKVLGNDAFFRIENNITLSVDFTYKLIDNESPLEIVFYVLEEDDEIIKIDIE